MVTPSTPLPDHPLDALQDAVDGRLGVTERAALDQHLETCQSCRRELDALLWTKQETARLKHADAPAGLASSLSSLLDEEDRRAAQAPADGVAHPGRPADIRRSRPVLRWVIAAGVIVSIGLSGWLLTNRADRTDPALAFAYHRAFAKTVATLPVVVSDGPALEALLLRERPAVRPRVFDFGMMGLQLIGGGPHRLGQSDSALFAYRDGQGRLVLCQMYVGRAASLPDPLERRTLNGIEFLIYRDAGITAVFWQEGDTLCVLTAEGDAKTALGLAAAKAIKT